MKNIDRKHCVLLGAGLLLIALILPGVAFDGTKKTTADLGPAKKSVVAEPKDKHKVIALKIKATATIPERADLAPLKAARAGPKLLSNVQRLEVLKSGGSGVAIAKTGAAVASYLRLTPRNPYVAGPNKGYLQFLRPSIYSGLGDAVVFGDSGDGEILCAIWAEPTGRFLIEAGVLNQSGAGAEFSVLPYTTDEPKQTMSGVTADRPLVFLLDATAVGWHMFRLRGSKGMVWHFNYFEVTRLN